MGMHRSQFLKIKKKIVFKAFLKRLRRVKFKKEMNIGGRVYERLLVEVVAY